jgi:competence protein ComEC
VRIVILPATTSLLACSVSQAPLPPIQGSSALEEQAAACPSGPPMRVRFYDAGQALSVLVTLPDGRRVLVDTGESPRRPCKECPAWHDRVTAGLRDEVGAGALDLLWITHQHSDHVGGAPGVLETFRAALYVDNGLDLDKTAVVRDARAAAIAAGAQLHVVDPQHADAPMEPAAGVTLTPIVPAAWPSACAGDENACSIALRIDYCKSSVLFTGDATAEEEELLDTRGEVTLLQVGHHGGDTSTGDAFLARTSPKYAVISAAKPGEGTNEGYCHPRSVTVENLTRAMGGPGGRTVTAFDGAVKCKRDDASSEHWIDVPASDRLWITARDGDVTLTTTGDGTFAKK